MSLLVDDESPFLELLYSRSRTMVTGWSLAESTPYIVCQSGVWGIVRLPTLGYLGT